ncbi:uncharacterized protein LOC142317523 [Lycorma delicatula]|uniref:uncharacterized protein LOC142317523 n=1 Tax=Lycorma delicatula TaxID=130591 RepID=UPI003F5101E1
MLVCSKSRVAPLKRLTLPWLELCGATLAAKLSYTTTISLKLNLNNRYYWSVSKIVLAWIKSSSTNWNVFVANRVGKFLEISDADEWNHVRGDDNLADRASQGVSTE